MSNSNPPKAVHTQTAVTRASLQVVTTRGVIPSFFLAGIQEAAFRRRTDVGAVRRLFPLVKGLKQCFGGNFYGKMSLCAFFSPTH